jgi:hypothetical protein
MLACDFLTVETVLTRIYVLFFARPALEVADGDDLIQHKPVVGSGCESRPGSCQEAR